MKYQVRHSLACARLSANGDERKSGRAAKKRASENRREKWPGLSPAPTRFSRQFVFLIRFSDYLGAWNRLDTSGKLIQMLCVNIGFNCGNLAMSHSRVNLGLTATCGLEKQR